MFPQQLFLLASLADDVNFPIQLQADRSGVLFTNHCSYLGTQVPV